MEEKHIPTEHMTANMCRPCGYPVVSQPDALQERLTEKAAEEMYRLQNTCCAKEHSRYRGVCATLGNPVFSDTPVEPPSYVQPIRTYGLQGYKSPAQHPMYTTTSGDYGQPPSLGLTPSQYFGRDCSLTQVQSRGGMYEDTHLTTEVKNNSLCD